MLLLICLLLICASVLSVYSYGHFARRAQGAPGQTLPHNGPDTAIDKAVAPLADANPDQTGLVLLSDNLEAFAVRALSARHAGRSLDVQYYIWHNDLTGRLLGYELLRAADRGVRVRAILDDLNVHDKDSVMAALDLHPNIEIRLFNPSRGRQNSLMRGIEMLTRGFMLNRRMHNKAWIADGRIAIVGGRNIGDEYFDASQGANFFDVDLALCGRAVDETSAIFDNFWNSPAVIPLQALVEADPNSLEALRQASADGKRLLHNAQPYLQRLKESASAAELFQDKRPIHWTAQAHVYSDPPEKAAGLNEQAWLINVLMPVWTGAERQMYMISPYFVPSEAGLQGLRTLRERGVDIGILTNSLAATDVIMVHGGYAPYRRPLLEEGVDLYELMPEGKPDHSFLGSSGTSLHTKAFMVDGESGFVGSFNLDPRSVRLNTEMGILFQQPDITAELLASYSMRTSSGFSYRLFLHNGQLRWEDGSVEPPRIWNHEPASGFWSRVAAKVVEWLPVESQL